MANGTPRIRFEGVSKRYGLLNVIDNLNLSIEGGEFISLLGPSGSGKTTLLMILAGFESPTAGKVWLDGRQIEGVPAHRRDMGVVFQNYALFPHMSAAENIAFPLKRRGRSKAEIAASVSRVLDMVQLSSLADRRPAQMSGGQQQRIALARALVFEPAVVLMDEPLGALDKQLREQMQLDIRELHRRLGLTIVFVTHDQGEALTMSNRIAVFNGGRIEQVGTPDDVYDRPTSRFVAEFIGETNLLPGSVLGVEDGIATVAVGAERFRVRTARAPAAGQAVELSVRPERIALREPGPVEGNALEATVTDTVYQGDHIRVSLRTAVADLVVRSGRGDRRFQAGERVVARFADHDGWVVQS